ncbi:MAG: hypothetical protein M3160_04200, partial [Candidatus Eremiobacteraeota bacterium]|nr:hypothetical protein [Candidatus Eremiobacteraeota bacterium]
TAVAYAAAIMQALLDGRKKAAGARHRAKAFNMTAQIDAVLGLYRRLVSPRSTLAAASEHEGFSAI